jgi:hypothetical protein
VSIVAGGTADLAMDRPATWLSFHTIFETLMIAGALLMATTLWLGWWRSAQSTVSLRESLEAQRLDRDAWKASAEAALEALAARSTRRSERTVRQHAGVVYEKAGIAGRAELAAFFLNDLMLPEDRSRRAPSS